MNRRPEPDLANIAAQENCVGGDRDHDFREETKPGEGSSRGRWRCARCNATIDHVKAKWYRRGLSAGMRRAERMYREAEARAKAEAERLPAGGWGAR